MLEPIKSQRLHREVQIRLRMYIIDNKLEPGDRLPTEKEIASQLGVSRNVVREALKALEALGLVEVRMGSGTHVARFDAARYLDNYTYSLMVNGVGIKELWEVRRALELAFIDKVVEHIGDEDLQELDDQIAAMEAIAADSNILVMSLQIHHLMYRCLKNNILTALFDAFGEFWSRIYEPEWPISPDVSTWCLQIHKRLVKALHRRDANAARAALEEDFGSTPTVISTD